MLKMISRSLTALLLTVCFKSYALPIIEADAFNAGDNKAVLDTSTGLTWLDFGVNRAQSFNSVMSQLSTTYLGWRLPTESEVRNLWGQLFTGTSSTDEQYEICDLWGANRTPLEHTPYQAFGYFIDNNGYLGHGSFLEGGSVVDFTNPKKFYVDGTIDGEVYSGDGRKYDGSTSYYPFNFGIEEISTLLVRDGASANVPEPSTIFLFSLGLCGLALGRRRKAA